MKRKFLRAWEKWNKGKNLDFVKTFTATMRVMHRTAEGVSTNYLNRRPSLQHHATTYT